MSESKHTPRPWIYDHQADWVIVRDVGTQKVICHSRNPDFHQNEESGFFYAGRDPHEPIARLIAAAPELLEALEAFMKCDKESGYIRPKLQDMARSAIAKARGE